MSILPSKILGHNSIKVTLDSYGVITNELMLRNVKELKEKLLLKKDSSKIDLSNNICQSNEDLIAL
jgi:hypothetical protein